MQGTVVKFDSERGFGFIRMANQPDDVFVHVSDVAERHELVQGQRVTFELTETEKGPRAVNVVPGRVQRSPYVIFGTIAAVLTIAGLLILHAWLSVSWLTAYLIAINICTILFYAYDKAIAGSGALRVPERTLQMLALLFGSPGAWISQQLFHHKTHKEPFRTQFRIIVIVQTIVIIGVIWWMR